MNNRLVYVGISQNHCNDFHFMAKLDTNNMDTLDRNLIIELQKNPRKSSRLLAKQLGVNERTISKRIDQLESSAELAFTALPDLKLFGYPVNALFKFRLDQPMSSSELAKYIAQYTDFRFVSTCEGFADIYAAGNFESEEYLAEFITNRLSNIIGISRIDTIVELKEVKKKTFGRIDISDNMANGIHQNHIKITELDRHLILELQKNCRVPLKQLCETLKTSEPTLNRHINKLIKSRTIELTAIANTLKIGYPNAGTIEIEAKLPKINNIIQSISRHPQVSFSGIYTGPKQIIAGVWARSHEDLLHVVTHEFAKIEGILRLDLLIFLDVYKANFSWIPE
jgi:Lrp/AsnC family transcriptional regulator for asnA, asnC and gidA